MDNLKDYEEKRKTRMREYAGMFNTEIGKRFIKEEILPVFNQSVGGSTEFVRGTREGERNLARVITELANYKGENNE